MAPRRRPPATGRRDAPILRGSQVALTCCGVPDASGPRARRRPHAGPEGTASSRRPAVAEADELFGGIHRDESGVTWALPLQVLNGVVLRIRSPTRLRPYA
jgi:hypothetical protein